MYPHTGEAAIRVIYWYLSFDLPFGIYFEGNNSMKGFQYKMKAPSTSNRIFLKTEIFFSVKSLRGDDAPMTYKHFSTLF